MRPKGFLFSVADAAIKQPGHAEGTLIKPDMALICSETEATAAATFTTNKVKAAPVRLDMKRIASGRGRAVVINSGNANACTGRQGLRDAQETAKLIGQRLGIPEGLIYVCSTGVIGVPLPMDRIRQGAEGLSANLGKASLEDAAMAIMTTDSFPKLASREVKIGRRGGVISAICKGAGMINPKMATMLCFVLTDIAVEKNALKSALRDAVGKSFNRITVEGDMSTNDTVLALANGALGNLPLKEGSKDFKSFGEALSDITAELSALIVKDAEGATKFVEIEVRGAKTELDAKKAANAVANSALVKTAIYGADPNWGRIMAALGRSGAAVIEEKTGIHIGGVRVVDKGVSTGKEDAARLSLMEKKIKISINLNSGKGDASVLTCDLTEEFVRLNSKYTT